MSTSPFALKYQLERNLRTYNREEVRKLEHNQIGLYVLWVPAEAGGGFQYIYAGMSRSCLRRRLREHLGKEKNPKLRRDLQLFRDVAMFSVAYTRSREETRPLEKHVIADWQPLTNREGMRDL